MPESIYILAIRLLALASILLLLGCAGAPATVEERGASSTAAPASRDATRAVPDGPPVDVERYEAAGGYRRVQRNDRHVYCRQEVPTGSRMAEQTCVSEAELAELARRAEELREMRTPRAGEHVRPR